MHHLVPAAPAQQGLDPLRAVPGDPAHVRGGVGGEAAGEQFAAGSDDGDGIAALELALDGAHAGGQQRASLGERARGARVIAIAEEGDAAVLPFADEVLHIPLAGPLFEPLLAVVPLHIFAMGLATAKGLDVDQPRNLAKSVTVE